MEKENTKITIGLVGLPSAGKSSIINSLVGKRIAQSGVSRTTLEPKLYENLVSDDNIKFNIGSVETLDKDCIYSLQSLGFHYGNLSGGHYTALCDMKDETFNFYNDNDIKTFKKADVYLELKENNTAYLIVYELS